MTTKHHLIPMIVLLVITSCNIFLASHENVNAYVATYNTGTCTTTRIRPIQFVRSSSSSSSSSSPVLLHNSNNNNYNNNDNKNNNNNIDVENDANVTTEREIEENNNLFFSEKEVIEADRSSTVLKTHAADAETFATTTTGSNNHQKNIDIIATASIKTEPTKIEEATNNNGGAKFGDDMPLRKNPSSETAQFGDAMPLKRPSSSSSSQQQQQQSAAQFGDVMPLRKPVEKTTTAEKKSSKQKDGVIDDVQLLMERKRRNLIVAVVSFMLAIGNYGWQYTHPVTPIQLLVQMERSSSPVEVIGNNNKPSVVDFWAPWCENCRYMAPTLYQIEESYKDRVNFVSVNGDDPNAWQLIEKFGVDAIPHLALVESDGTVDTALIGIVPKEYLTKDIDVLVSNAAAAANTAGTTDPRMLATTTTKAEQQQQQEQQQRKPLPFQMLDVFANKSPEERKIRF